MTYDRRQTMTTGLSANVFVVIVGQHVLLCMILATTLSIRLLHLLLLLLLLLLLMFLLLFLFVLVVVVVVFVVVVDAVAAAVVVVVVALLLFWPLVAVVDYLCVCGDHDDICFRILLVFALHVLRSPHIAVAKKMLDISINK